MFRPLLTITVLALMIAGGVLQGIWTNRWHLQDESFRDHVDRMNRIPMTIGDWDGREESDEQKLLPEEERGRSIVRNYVNRFDVTKRVSIYITYAPWGPLCFNHTPLGCYPGHGYKLDGERTKVVLTEGVAHPSEFWVANFSKTDSPVPYYVRVFWSWSGSEIWLAPEPTSFTEPRTAFAGHAGLYKMYVTRNMTSPGEPLQTDPIIEFTRSLIPELAKTLSPNS
jgi:hypothetical protein